jgi:hypothetical protein
MAMRCEATMSEQVAAPRGGGFVITQAEFDGLYGAGPLGMAIYLVLRAAMDFNTGQVGMSTKISLHGLASGCERHVSRGKGFQIVRPSEKDVRMGLQSLVAQGLILRIGNAECLAFQLLKARVSGSSASVRQFQTGHSAGTLPGTDAGRLKLIAGAGLQPEPGTVAEGIDPANRAHIRDQGLLLSTSQAAYLDQRDGAVDKSAADMELSTMQNSNVAKITQLLIDEGLKTLPNSPMVRRWVGQGITIAKVKSAISKARQRRLEAGSAAPINVPFIDSILKDDETAKAKGWEDRARAVGVEARAGESWEAYRRRVKAAEDARHA